MDTTLRLVTAVVCTVAASMACTKAAERSARTADTRAQDRAAIERLYQQATKATLAGDMTALGELWTDDVVLIGPGQEAQVGKEAILASRRKAPQVLQVLSYVPEIKDVMITADGWAFERGVFTGTYIAPGGEKTRVRMNRLSVLKKQADRSWKVAVAMTNTAE